MIKKLKRAFKLHRIFITQHLKSLMEYKIDFLTGAISFFLEQFVSIVFIWIIFSQIPDLYGWTYDQIIFIYGFSLIPKGLDHLFCDNIWSVGYFIVAKGAFDKYLTRPINTLFQVLVEKFQVDALGEFILGIVLVVYSFNNLGTKLGFLDLILFLIIIPFASTIYTSVKIITASLSFWIKQSGHITHMFYAVNNFAKYPTTIYNSFVKTIITYIVPFAFTAFYPASYFITHENPLFNLGGTIIISIIFFAVSCLIWKKGLKAYESAGS